MWGFSSLFWKYFKINFGMKTSNAKSLDPMGSDSHWKFKKVQNEFKNLQNEFKFLQN